MPPQQRRRSKRSDAGTANAAQHDFVIELTVHKNQTVSDQSVMKLLAAKSDKPVKYKILKDPRNVFELEHVIDTWQLSFRNSVNVTDRFVILIQGDSYENSDALGDGYINSLVHILVQ